MNVGIDPRSWYAPATKWLTTAIHYVHRPRSEFPYLDDQLQDRVHRWLHIEIDSALPRVDSLDDVLLTLQDADALLSKVGVLPTPSSLTDLDGIHVPTQAETTAMAVENALMTKCYIYGTYFALRQCIRGGFELERVASYWRLPELVSLFQTSCVYVHKLHASWSRMCPQSIQADVLESMERGEGGVGEARPMWTCPSRQEQMHDFVRLATHLAVVADMVEQHEIPSHFRRHWVRYALLGSTILLSSYFVYRNRSEISQWIADARIAVTRFVGEHVLEPLQNLWAFIRYDQHKQLIDPATVDIDDEALQNMVKAFCEDAKLPVGLDSVMGAYERELQHPIKNAVVGHLTRLMLIQVQKQKVDVERTMVALDRLLKSNEINFELIAMMPAILILTIGLYQAVTYRRDTDMRLFEGMRHSLVQCERMLNRSLYDACMSDAEEGLLWLQYHRVRMLVDNHANTNAATALGRILTAQQDEFLSDLKEITEDSRLQVQQRLNSVQRTLRAYPFLAVTGAVSSS
jgi:hypothetical protein